MFKVTTTECTSELEFHLAGGRWTKTALDSHLFPFQLNVYLVLIAHGVCKNQP